jgi:two-component system, NarL family, nitrate/nitrite response regulator NarL
MPMVSIRLVLADDHPIVLHGLQQLFARQGDFTVVAACADGATAIDAVKTHRPDILVLDLRMSPRNGLDVLRALAKERLACRTVLLTAAITDEEVVEAMRLGAMGLVLKEASPDALLDCVRRVHRGEQWIERETVTQAFKSVLKRESAISHAEATLTPRELEIVRMVAHGLRNKVIAERLTISEGTVKVHLHNIYEKLGVDGRLELVLCAQEKGLV